MTEPHLFKDCKTYPPVPAGIQQLAKDAQAAGWSKCIAGGEAVFYYPASCAAMPGHIYSEDGRTEWKISGLCEYHFDECTIFVEDWE